ncbi:DUF808 domain-containing protein [Sphingomonas sp.]|uniref:DUF808 domain-containing protein n=1 Tax=Sphingomonas sp. TaxID=28214 RepID=UPI003AFFF300
MPGGLLALLDDVAALARLAAASVDDVAAAAGRAGAKTAGVVIDDAAVTPGYVVGLPPERELPIIFRIAVGSLRNKLIFILPVALLLSAFAPWALTPLLMIGGVYLSFEGAEKILAAFHRSEEAAPVAAIGSPQELEERQVGGAIRTDFILSAEIMVITLNELGRESIGVQAMVLALVGFLVTVAVYGVVGVLVKIDDIGLNLSLRGGGAARLGRGLVRAMPVLLKTLALVGTAAMLWVGGGILIHGAAAFGWTAPEHLVHGLSHGVAGDNGAVVWAITAICSAIVGLVVGAIVAGLLHLRPAKPH